MRGLVNWNSDDKEKRRSTLLKGTLRSLAPEVAIVADICDAFYQGHS